MRKSTRIAATVASAGLIAAAMAAPASARGGPTIVSVASAANTSGPFTGAFDTLLAAATCTAFEGAIIDALSGKGQRTLFAPTDDAFAALGIDEENVCDVAGLGNILTFHVTEGRRPAGWLGARVGSSITMLNGEKAAITATNSGIAVDGAKVIVTNVPASNGFIHAVDMVLIPG